MVSELNQGEHHADRYDSDPPMSSATLNQVLTLTYRLAQREGKIAEKTQDKT